MTALFGIDHLASASPGSSKYPVKRVPLVRYKVKRSRKCRAALRGLPQCRRNKLVKRCIEESSTNTGEGLLSEGDEEARKYGNSAACLALEYQSHDLQTRLKKHVAFLRRNHLAHTRAAYQTA